LSNRAVIAAEWLFPIAVMGLLIAAGPAGGFAAPQAPRAIAETEDAVKLIQEDRLREALATLDRAVTADGEYWRAHYQRGRVLGQLGRWQESEDALLRATELNPGHGHSHRLAALAAANVGDWEVAWDQAIKAQLAGEDMTQTFLGMYQESPPPADFEIRINAATIFVAPIDTSPAAADVELPTNFNPNAAPVPGQRQGRPANQEDSAISQSSLDLVRIQRAMRGAVAESPRLAVVLDPERARYILSIQLTEISTSQPNRGTGYIRLIDVGEKEIVHRQPIELPNLGSMADIAGRLRRYVTDLTARLAERDAR
jgi:hypothetical protein